MHVEEKAIYLLKLVNRYMDVVKEAKIILEEECLPEISKNGAIDSNLRIKSRTVSTIDNNMLATAYPEEYEQLYKSGKLVAKIQDLKDFSSDLLENVVTTKKSSWLEYNDKN